MNISCTLYLHFTTGALKMQTETSLAESTGGFGNLERKTSMNPIWLSPCNG